MTEHKDINNTNKTSIAFLLLEAMEDNLCYFIL